MGYMSAFRGDAHQVVVILEGIMQGGDPLAVSIHQDFPLFSETRSLQKIQTVLLNVIVSHKHFYNIYLKAHTRPHVIAPVFRDQAQFDKSLFK